MVKLFGPAIIVLVTFLWLLLLRQGPTNVIAARDCENRYKLAASAADSAIIDDQPLVVAVPPRSRAPSTCGALRAMGRLK